MFFKGFFFAIAFIGASFLCLDLASAQIPIPEKKPDFSSHDNDPDLIDKIGNFFSDLVEDDTPTEDAPPQALIEEHPQNTLQDTLALIRNLQVKTPSNTLEQNDSKLYRDIFALQKRGDFAKANDLITQLDNSLLLGHVLYQRYMHPRAYKSNFEELQNWLEHYADHPGADKIYSFAQKKNSDTTILNAPSAIDPIRSVQGVRTRKAKRHTSSRSGGEAIKREIRKSVRFSAPENALALLSKRTLADALDIIDIDTLKADIAAAFLYQGKIDEAYVLAADAVQRSRLHVPKAAWVAGLISWHRENYNHAAQYFEVAAQSEYASNWMVTAASYWAARAHMRVGNVKNVTPWLKQGSVHLRTFYGLISTRALGINFRLSRKIPTFTKAYHDTLVSSSAGARAVALAKVGQSALAQSELLQQRPSGDEQRSAYIAFANYARLPVLSMRLANLSSSVTGQHYDSASYPFSPWEPNGGYKIDKALIHAIIRQESRFDPNAESPSGAKGLMQILPSTARAVSKAKAHQMDNPSINLELGQRYLNHLLNLSHVNHNLLYLLIAYNAGPGNLKKWQERWPDVDDPLLFIELLPSAETRAYIERVLSNYWMYRLREKRDIPSLDAIAAGRPAMYRDGT